MTVSQIITEITGYIGMIIVVSSFLCRNIKAVRIVNIIGSLICSIYAVLTNTIPTLALNVALLLVNSFMLIIEITKKEEVVYGFFRKVFHIKKKENIEEKPVENQQEENKENNDSSK